MELFLSLTLSILNSSILETLRSLDRPSSTISALVAGGKAINAMLKLEYRVSTTDWDINAWDPRYVNNLTAPEHQTARDRLGNLLVQNLKLFLDRERYRIRPIEDNLNIKIKDIVYEVNPKLFKSFYQIDYTIGHVNLITDQGSIGVADLVPLPHSGDYLIFNNIKFPTLEVLIQNLENVIKFTDYKRERNIQRLQVIDDAIHSNGLSCNYYRSNIIGEIARSPIVNEEPKINPYGKGPISPPKNHLKINSSILDNELDRINYGRELKLCGNQTIMGPVDPLISPDVRMQPRYNINGADVDRHYNYIESLSPEQRKVVSLYTGYQSALWNMELYGNHLFGDPIIHGEDINTLQDIILNSPPLESEMTVYRVSRFIILDDLQPCCFNRPQKIIGSTEYFPTFLSSSFDNDINFGSFRDQMSGCCAFVIRVPKGSRVLIIDQHSTFPNEREVIFPAGSTFKLREERRDLQVTGVDKNDNIFYDSTITYFVDYQVPLNRIDELTLEDLPPLVPVLPKKNKGIIPIIPINIDLPLKDLDHLKWLEAQPEFQQLINKFYLNFVQS